ncbi:MAG: hypothetical protein HQL63_15610 [Magnetococcales bacterium]|nr:hypothetical protein [Magnetococcales bacterium]
MAIDFNAVHSLLVSPYGTTNQGSSTHQGGLDSTLPSSPTPTQSERNNLQAGAGKTQKGHDQIIPGATFGSGKLLAFRHNDSLRPGVSSWDTSNVSQTSGSLATVQAITMHLANQSADLAPLLLGSLGNLDTSRTLQLLS